MSDKSYEIIQKRLAGCSVKELTKEYGKDYLHHIEDVETAVKAIQNQEKSLCQPCQSDKPD